MDRLLGFLFGAFIVVTLAFLALAGATTGVLNLYVILDHLMSGWWFLPVALSWGLTGAVFFGLLYFAFVESPVFGSPGLRPALLLLAAAWLGAAWLAGQVEVMPDRVSKPLTYRPPNQPKHEEEPRRPRVVPGQPPTPGKMFETAYVDTGTLNVRRGPGEAYPVIDTISKGALVRIYDRKTAPDGRVWARIDPSSGEGWVSQRRLRFDQSKPADKPDQARGLGDRARVDTTQAKVRALEIELMNGLGDRALVDTTQANVRAGPGTDYGVVGKLGRGALVRIGERRDIADGSVWVRIESGGIAGWVNARLLGPAR
ncbi:membrane hypothetical protein [Thiocapsa sp. KS1]|nr:SH3 domain-containing protein [Thiocapsa sp. KS1]CRI67789.1 membrane hypothetical protein [Thiocapsa sp. KS1]